MPMLNVARVILSPAFAQNFTIYRRPGGWVGGKFVRSENPDKITVYGTAVPPNQKELEQIPEGDRVKGAMCFYSTEEVFVTRNDPDPGTSDEIECRGNMYRIYQVLPMIDFGYYQAIGARMAGD